MLLSFYRALYSNPHEYIKLYLFLSVYSNCKTENAVKIFSSLYTYYRNRTKSPAASVCFSERYKFKS